VADSQSRPGTRLAVIGLLLAIAVVAAARRAAAERDHRLPAGDCEAWMADALPGIGPKTREAMAAAIRSGEWRHLPSGAREVAKRVFSPRDR